MYCRRHRLSPVEDASNRSRRYTRNRVRLDLMPRLESFNPRVKAGLVRLADASRDEHAVVSGLARDWLTGHRRSLSRRSLAAQPTAVQVEVVRRIWSAAAGAETAVGDAAHLRQAVAMIDDKRRRGMVDLGRGLHLYVEDSRFYIASKPARRRR
jgi:tRNA(Ile)-lysidine synthase TilS/MesJ